MEPGRSIAGADMLIKWGDINSVNIRQLDKDHQQMAKLLDELSKKKDLKSVRAVLKKLMSYGIHHFKAEEKYFDEYNYPHKKSHTRQHFLFLKRVKEFEKKCCNNEPVVGELMEFLSGWWIDHVNNADLKYSTFLNKRGVY